MHRYLQRVFFGIQKRYILANGLVAAVLVDPLGSSIPGDNLSVHVHQRESKILYPGRNCVLSGIFVRRGCRRLVAQREQVANRQHVAFCHILDVPGRAVGTQKLERSHLLAFFEKSPPALGDNRPDFRNRKFVQAAADDFFTRQTQQFAGTDAGLLVAAIIIGNKDRGGGMEYYRTQQQLEFFGSVFRQPADRDGLRGRGVQNAFLLCPVDPGSRLPEERVRRVLQTLGGQEWRSALISYHGNDGSQHILLRL